MTKYQCSGSGDGYGSLGSVSFGPPGSGFGSVIIFKDPDPSIKKQKNKEKTLISTVLLLLNDFFIF
jgi:hypothetical protein